MEIDIRPTERIRAMSNLIEAFDAAHAVCGDAIVPPDYRSDGLFYSALHCDPKTLSFKEAVNAGVVHTMMWLNSRRYTVSSHPDRGVNKPRVVSICTSDFSRWDDFHVVADGTPPSLYAALLKIAVRVGNEAKEPPHGT